MEKNDVALELENKTNRGHKNIGFGIYKNKHQIKFKMKTQ